MTEPVLTPETLPPPRKSQPVYVGLAACEALLSGEISRAEDGGTTLNRRRIGHTFHDPVASLFLALPSCMHLMPFHVYQLRLASYLGAPCLGVALRLAR